ncbi:sensor histidine kinase [Nitrosophilus labii]|uniref:sensor histidine kinase n=1 Tax=Nitrosophilus labii TaxID=2706014 RepID=UPI001656F679|nr:ATP-binding protein [Nitrosophilus labii]
MEIECKNFVVKSHEGALRQILVNVLDNACKYNKKGGYVKIWTKKDTLFIKDSGIGIENIEKIFDRYYKEHQEGKGIGLHIVKTLCEAMDIDIDVESKKNFGTVFMFRFYK